MVTKWKNSRKTWYLLIAGILLLVSAGMTACYPIFARALKNPDDKFVNTSQLREVMSPLSEGNYLLYNQLSEETDESEVLKSFRKHRFNLLVKYVDYSISDTDGNVLLESSGGVSGHLLSDTDDSYALTAIFVFDANGALKMVQTGGSRLEKEEQYLLESALKRGDEHTGRISTPADVQIRYGMTEENLQAYIEAGNYSQFYITDLMNTSSYNLISIFFSLFVLIFALVLPVLLEKTGAGWTLSKCAVFEKPPLEAAVGALFFLCALSYSITQMVYQTLTNDFIVVSSSGKSGDLWNTVLSAMINICVWFAVFFVIFWAVLCIRPLFRQKGQYLKERSLIVRFLLWLKNRGFQTKGRIGRLFLRFFAFCKKQYNVLLHLDFKDNTNRTILRIVCINFVIVFIIGLFGFTGLWAAVLYSVLLFVFLRKYSGKIREQYQVLLCSTNQLAEGKLDMPISGDAGIFTPVQNELRRIQIGFKKAVDEEVKSERMKTELITNVSHDLKTPLTAIITYIDLVRKEQSEETRQEYIDILEGKSMRLKSLIEDLFEISKASSKNIVMHYMKIDIVDLLKQVGLEYENDLKKANLEIRWKLPEYKIHAWLDSQKTYRIFENLIVNISKYAMPHTRVYIHMEEDDTDVRIIMKNISAAELTFDTDEITDRFVRGDVSRNTEGSGLGLAIVKSFAELQHGSLHIHTDADLFKAEIVLPKGSEHFEAGTP